MPNGKGLVASTQNPAELVEQWEQIKKVAQELIKTKLLPKNVTTPEQVVAIITMGRELNIPMMEALRGINVIDQKPTLAPQLMLAIINRSEFLEDLKIEQQNSYCEVTMKRKGRTAYTVRFGETEAKQMNLLWKDNYKKQAKNMYKWRAISACARVVFPDVIGGLYLPDEIASHTDTEETMATMEQTAQIAGSADEYDKWLEEFWTKFEHDLELMTEPHDTHKWKKSHTQEYGMLLDNDRQKVDGMLEDKFNELVTGKTDLKAENPTLEGYIELAKQCKTSKEMIDWFKSAQSQIQKDLSNEDFLALVEECKKIKAELNGQAQDKPKGQPPTKVGMLIVYLEEAPNKKEFEHRISEIQKDIKMLNKKERQEFDQEIFNIRERLKLSK